LKASQSHIRLERRRIPRCSLHARHLVRRGGLVVENRPEDIRLQEPKRKLLTPCSVNEQAAFGGFNACLTVDLGCERATIITHPQHFSKSTGTRFRRRRWREQSLQSRCDAAGAEYYMKQAREHGLGVGFVSVREREDVECTALFVRIVGYVVEVGSLVVSI